MRFARAIKSGSFAAMSFAQAPLRTSITKLPATSCSPGACHPWNVSSPQDYDRANPRRAIHLLLGCLIYLAGVWCCPAASWAGPAGRTSYSSCGRPRGHALSCYGSKINRTPNLDRLATEVCASAIVSPSTRLHAQPRAILTGKYSHINGVTCSIASTADSQPWPNCCRRRAITPA